MHLLAKCAGWGACSMEGCLLGLRHQALSLHADSLLSLAPPRKPGSSRLAVMPGNPSLPTGSTRQRRKPVHQHCWGLAGLGEGGMLLPSRTPNPLGVPRRLWSVTRECHSTGSSSNLPTLLRHAVARFSAPPPTEGLDLNGLNNGWYKQQFLLE